MPVAMGSNPRKINLLQHLYEELNFRKTSVLKVSDFGR